MLAADGARPSPDASSRRRRRNAARRHARMHRRRRADRLARGEDRDRDPDRRRPRDPARRLRRLPALPRDLLMREGIFVTPRPAPGKLLPALAGVFVLLLALPVFLLVGWSLAGWGLGVVLWLAVEGVDVLLARLQGRPANLAASAVLAFGLMFRTVVVLAVLVATAATRPHLALAAAVVFGLAYTFQLGVSLTSYFGAER